LKATAAFNDNLNRLMSGDLSNCADRASTGQRGIMVLWSDCGELTMRYPLDAALKSRPNGSGSLNSSCKSTESSNYSSTSKPSDL